MKFRALQVMLVLAVAAAPGTVMVVEKGDMLLRFGYTDVSPKSDNHAVVSVESAASLGLNFSYMMTSNLSFEVLGAYTFEHDTKLTRPPVHSTARNFPWMTAGVWRANSVPTSC